MTKTIIFNIVKRKKIPNNFLNLEFHRNYPCHFEQFNEAISILVFLEYRPSKTLNEVEYINKLKAKLKKKYNAYSIEVGTLDKQLN